MGRHNPSKHGCIARFAALALLSLALVAGGQLKSTSSASFCGRASSRQVAVPRTTRFLFPPPPEKGADPDDLDRWRGRKIEWFFTEGEEDLKLSDLPRPAILPPEFWDWFYGTGMYFAVFQAITSGIGLVAIFLYAPIVVSKVLNAVLGVPMPSGL
mmetsp:Transcript_58891/g.137606  ORF Transcript_58891/g.137606 Transcript_58891/m.137606 type:complete len:156 (+) Transcript_58891:56-523(+)